MKASFDLAKAINETRRLFVEYKHPYDHSRSFGPGNVGPYDWQIEFFNAGVEYPERCLMTANQVGKTRTAAAECTFHALGQYPKWWQGKRFDHPVIIWTGAESAEDSRDIVQFEFLGQRGFEGTGSIPADRIVKSDKRQAGVTEVVETIHVRHVSGGVSTIMLKTYAQEARGWRGRRIHVCWPDELIPHDIYTEAQTRLLKNKGVMISTFTPLEGATEVVRHYLEGGPGIYYLNVGWDRAPHLDEGAKAQLAASYPEWERDTRTKGTPMLGTGAIFPIPDELIECAPMEIPSHWARINGMDFGIDHPGAGAFCAWDRDGDTFYVYDGYRKSGETPVYHAAAMKKHGTWIPNSWPHDGLHREVGEKGSLEALKDQYRGHGLNMCREFAQYRDNRKNSLEAGLIEMYEWMRTGRFRVFSTLNHWFEEKRMYHRKDGKVVASHDDLIAASRYAFMMRRYAIVKPPPMPVRRAPRRPIVGG